MSSPQGSEGAVVPANGEGAVVSPDTTASDKSAGDQSKKSTVNSQNKGTSDAGVEKTRALTGLFAVILGDVAIAISAILGIAYITKGTGDTSADASQIVAVLSGAFTAIGTMTTAYFGIKSIANAAQNITSSSNNSSNS